tara:strand:+ start:331 stop:726 length:396 start_codon:yes stop_codon:yes gene_type:complete
MANSRRVEKVAALIKREVGELLIHRIKDERVQESMISITSVEVSGDLQYCKIFVSVLGNEIYKEKVMAGLNDSSGFLKGELARRLKMRRALIIVFQLDTGMTKGADVLNILGKLQKEREAKDFISIKETKD